MQPRRRGALDHVDLTVVRWEDVGVAGLHPDAAVGVAEGGAGEGAVWGDIIEAWAPVLTELPVLVPLWWDGRCSWHAPWHGCRRDGRRGSNVKPGVAGWRWRRETIVCWLRQTIAKTKCISLWIMWARVPAVARVQADASHDFESRNQNI